METHAPKAVFLSYAREDATAARRIAEALRSSGIEVWFDESELRGGDAWDQKIRRQIKDCSLFLAIISAHTQERGEGYFRLEWNLAVERTRLMMEGVPFLVPVVVDETPESTDMVPEPFIRVQWTRLSKGLPTPQFIEQVQRLLALPRKPVAPTPRAEAASHAPIPAGRSSFPMWPLVAVGVVGFALVGYLVTRPHTKEPTTSPKASADVTPARPAPVVSEKSIAVLPFENMSDDKEANAFFADGIHDDVLTTLQNIREIRVVSRTSVMGYRGTTKNIRDVAKELGVAYILEGSVRRAGNSVRVTGQLIDARTDAHLWANQYDRELTTASVFAIQSELAKAIAGELKATLSPQEKKLLERRPTENLAAYELYLKARPLSTRGRVALRERGKFLQTAVELDPNFSEAWGELADNHAAHVFQGFDCTPARLAQADAAMARAVRLAPDNPEIIRLLGKYALHGYRDYARAFAQFEKVIRLQPNNADAIFFLGAVRRRQGRWLEALGYMRKAVELDPGNAFYANTLAASLEYGRRWDEALAVRRREIALQPDNLQYQAMLAGTEWLATGSTKNADDWLARLTPAQLAEPRIMAVRKFWANAKGDYAEWKRLDGLQPYFDEEDTPHWSQAIYAAMILAAHGDTAGAGARLGTFPAEVRTALELEPANHLLWRGLSLMEALLGQKEEALRDARKAVELLPETLDAAYGPLLGRNLAVVYAWTGDKDRALAELTRLLRIPYGTIGVHYMRVDTAYAPLRGDPRFEALLNDPKNNAPLF